ncbi:hypothetical protein [Micromonospora sp. NPDC023644]|uniref:hypothetical protein n=1 Tax=Micromonospora sp. NPDC023644 TaxID=3154321 RepID=UPI0033E3C216
MTHRVSAIDDHRRIVPRRGSAPVSSRRFAAPSGHAVPIFGLAVSCGLPAVGRVVPAAGCSAAGRARVAPS